MFKLFIESILSPFRYLLSSIIIFVLFFLQEVIFSATFEGALNKITLISSNATYIIYGLALYVIFLSVSVYIRIHRKIITGNADGVISFLPTSFEITYTLYAGAMIALIYISFIVATVVQVFISTKTQNLINSVPEYLKPIFMYGILFVATLIILQIVTRLSFSFPRVAIDRGKEKLTRGALWKTFIFSPNTLIMLLIIGLSLVPYILLQQAGIRILNLPDPTDVTSILTILFVCFLHTYSAIVVVSAISYNYRDYVLPELQVKQ